MVAGADGEFDELDEGPLEQDICDDDEGYETVPCPSCGAEISELAERCPICGDWITPGAGGRGGIGLRLVGALLLGLIVLWLVLRVIR